MKPSAEPYLEQTNTTSLTDNALVPPGSPSGALFSRHSFHNGIARVAPSVVSLYSSSAVSDAQKERENASVARSAESDTQSRSNEDLSASLKPGPDLSDAEQPSLRRTNQGSGVIVDSNGIVLTNLHLVDGADEISVVLSNGSLHTGRLIGGDRETDLAVVKIEVNDLPAVDFENAPRLRVGDIVLAIGNPFGVGQTVTQGIVSATRRRISGGSAFQNFVQIDAAINPGNSGGALINPDGQLVGINTAVFRRRQGAEGIGFAIPADLLAQVVPEIIRNGHVSRGWLGANVDDLPMFPSINRRVREGAVITGLYPASPALRAGLAPRDVIISLDGEKVISATGLLLMISSHAPDSLVELTVLRGRNTLTLATRLGERPEQGEPAPR